MARLKLDLHRYERTLRDEEFWALADVSFEVPRGEALGIIGRNGAGKSTVLKLLNRILKPTRGMARVTGRSGALIEVAAGFHPDLTGRENVFLQGAIMGMRRAEIAARFDEIVAFAGVERFIDTPVKRYSSGMSARLGFSIAAHLNPDVLLIDEVLAVGDLGFQEKCHARMKEFRRAGVSIHSLHQFRHTCASDLLEAGVHLAQVQRILGHSGIATTVRYVHIADPQRRAAMHAHPLNDWLGLQREAA